MFEQMMVNRDEASSLSFSSELYH